MSRWLVAIHEGAGIVAGRFSSWVAVASRRGSSSATLTVEYRNEAADARIGQD
jgi:hypothetical protein